jgi:hypothetical protein
MKKIVCLSIVASLISIAGVARGGEGASRFGVGAHYWKTVDNVDVNDVDEDGIAWLATYQYKPDYLGLGLDLEWKKKGFGGAPEAVYEPQAYLILGKGLYGAAGIGGYYSDGEFADDPFFFFRAGLDIEFLPPLHLDIHGIYRFEKWNSLNNSNTDIDSDTVTLGAAVRLAL